MSLFDLVENLSSEVIGAIKAIGVAVAIGFVIVKMVQSRLSVLSLGLAAVTVGLALWLLDGTAFLKEAVQAAITTVSGG